MHLYYASGFCVVLNCHFTKISPYIHINIIYLCCFSARFVRKFSTNHIRSFIVIIIRRKVSIQKPRTFVMLEVLHTYYPTRSPRFSASVPPLVGNVKFCRFRALLRKQKRHYVLFSIIVLSVSFLNVYIKFVLYF